MFYYRNGIKLKINKNKISRNLIQEHGMFFIYLYLSQCFVIYRVYFFYLFS